MTSGTTTTDAVAGNENGGRAASAARPSRGTPNGGRLALAVTLVLCALALAGRDLMHSAWYEDRRFAAMPLRELERERAGRLDNPRLLYYIGVRLNAQGRYTEADPMLRNAVGLDPDSARLRDAWAQALVGSRLISAAFGELREFEGAHPRSAEAHLLLGKFYLGQNSAPRASEELSRAVELDPALAEGWSLLAASESSLDRFDAARRAIEHAVALRPTDVHARIGLALLLEKLGRADAARTQFEAAAAAGAASEEFHREYARYLLDAAGEPARAEQQARAAVLLDGKDRAALRILGQSLAALGRPKEGIPYLQRSAELDPFDPLSALVLAQTLDRAHRSSESARWRSVYMQRQRRVDRKTALLDSLARNPKEARAQRELAQMMAQEGDAYECLRHEAAAANLPPDNPVSLTAAANDLVAADHAPDALSYARQAVYLAPNSPTAREALGNALLVVGRVDEAAAAYSAAARVLPDRARLYQDRLRRRAL